MKTKKQLLNKRDRLISSFERMVHMIECGSNKEAAFVAHRKISNKVNSIYVGQKHA